MRTANKIIVDNFATLAKIYDVTHYDQGGTVPDTIRAAIDAIGYDATVETIAAAVNCKAHDGRISDRVRSWAREATTEGGEDEYIPGSDKIHPAHLDQLADVMRKTERPEPDPVEVEKAFEDAAAQEAATEIEEPEEDENLRTLRRIRAELYEIQNGEQIGEDGEPVTLWDYFADVLDFEYTITSQREYKSVKVWITLGGPNICIDTGDNKIKLYWWSDYAELWFDSSLADEIDSIFEEYFNC